jgi:hypothetical protein
MSLQFKDEKYKNFLDGKTKEDLIKIILSNEATRKSVRNELIKKDYASMNIPAMDVYSNLSNDYGITERMVQYILVG